MAQKNINDTKKALLVANSVLNLLTEHEDLTIRQIRKHSEYCRKMDSKELKETLNTIFKCGLLGMVEKPNKKELSYINGLKHNGQFNGKKIK